MTFRPRRQPLGPSRREQQPASPTAAPPLPTGVRPSVLDGRPTTSTGTRSIDHLLAGHAGLPLGHALLIEESGTTDFGGYLLKYYAAEGVVQGHEVHVLGMDEAWGRELPGIAREPATRKVSPSEPPSAERMKIAWRYERLGEFGGGIGPRDRQAPQDPRAESPAPYCHDFDLSQRLPIPSSSTIKFMPIRSSPSCKENETNEISPLTLFLNHLLLHLKNSQPNVIHRVVIPNLLSPVYYSPEICQPQSILQFFHAFRALLRRYPTQLTAMITIPLTIHPRNTGLTRWIEILNDGVLELIPFPLRNAISTRPQAGKPKSKEDFPQGMFKIHKLPVFHEKGGGSGEISGFSNDFAFTFSRRKGLLIKPYSLPPVEGDDEIQLDESPEHHHQNNTKIDIQF
ncbi:hypothetical protein K3495_g2182 [Podosphaera aphanis]|nr:hypothetical protein K3495_g2182 [Podosphaera aphanis]